MGNRLTRIAPALAWAVAGVIAVRRSQRGWGEVIPATSRPVDTTTRAVLARPDSPPGPATETPDEPCDEEPIPTQTGQGPGPVSPLGLSPPDWKASVKRALKEFRDDRGTLTAAGMAFYWFLSIVPAMVALVGLLGLFNLSEAAIGSIRETVSRLPRDAANALAPAIANIEAGGSVLAAIVGIALALWSASAGMVGMQMGLDVAYDVTDTRKFVKKRLVALELMAAMLVLGGLATAFIVFGAPLGNVLRDNLPLGGAFVVLWTVVRWVLGLTALTMLFATVYYLAPNRDSPRWVWVSPGGVLAAVIWLAASLGFSFYVANFGNYGETYGSLAGVVVLLLWLYLTALAVVLGGELNAELERQSAARNGQVPPESVAT
ncbi:MAG: YihY family inner membrane protein [Actinomycetota bacterium]|nr:YihY family inner membrane protein [Actinomycetota bacterium]